jgi:hypothetical protein
MPIDDELEKSAVADEIGEESQKTIQSMLVRAGLMGAVSLLDTIGFGVGTAINEMLTQLASRRAYERMHEMFEQMKRQID